MYSFSDIKVKASKSELCAKLDEIVFFIGSEADASNAIIIAGFISAIGKIKGYVNGELESKADVLNDITEIAYYIGAEMRTETADLVAQSISALYEVKHCING